MLSPWVAFKRVTGAGGAPWIVGTVLIGLILIPLSRGLVSPAPAMDEGIPLLYPELVLKGHLPYRDFESVYGPGDILVLAAAYAVGGPSIEIERGVGLLYRCLILAAIFMTAARWGTGLATCCAALSGILLNCTGATAYAWIAAVAFGLVSLCVLGSGDTLWRAF